MYISLKGTRVRYTQIDIDTCIHTCALVHTIHILTYAYTCLKPPARPLLWGGQETFGPLHDTDTFPGVSPHTWAILIRTRVPDSLVQPPVVPEGETELLHESL